MKNEESGISWGKFAVVGGLAVAASIGVYCIIKRHKRDEDEPDGKIIQESSDPLKEALALKERGNSFFKGGKYDSALKCYMDSLEMCPDMDKIERAKLFQNKAAALENLGRINEVLPALNEALNLFPRYEKALNRRSKCLEANGRFSEALIDITAAAIFDNFRTPEFLNRMESLVKKISENEMNFEKCDVLTLQSDRYISIYLKSFPSDPLMIKDELIEEGSDDDEVVKKCLELYREEQYESCFEQVQTLLKSDNNNLSEECLSRMLVLRGTFYTLSCREDLALQDFNKVISNSHATPSVTINALIKKAMLMMVSDEMMEVDKAFTEALQIDAGYADIYYHRGSFYENCTKNDEAIRDFSRALELLPPYSFSAVHKAYNEYQRSKMMGMVSLDHFNNLIKQFPECVECHVIYAQVLLNEGNLAEAEKICSKILKVQPGSGTILMTMAMVKLSQEKVAEAKKLLQDTIKLDPKYAFSYHTLATIFIKDGDLQKALELMDEAVKYARNKAELQNFIATREGVRAQWKVSVNYNIPPAEIFAGMMRAANMSLM